MARKRIVRTTKFAHSIKSESPLRRLFEEKGKDIDKVRMELKRKEWQGVSL